MEVLTEARKHFPDGKKFYCPNCKYVLNSSGLRKAFTQERPFTCPECQHSFMPEEVVEEQSRVKN